MLKKIFWAIFISSCVTTSAWALDLQQAKSNGLVGEQTNGYLGVVKSSTEVEALVKDINAKRQHHYQRIAKQNGISVQDVASLAAQKAIAAADKGHIIQNKQGQWQTK